MKRIKQQGCALDRREYDPRRWLAAVPVCDHNRLVMTSLAIVAPSVRTSGMKLRNVTSTL
ncbi:MAG: hypothetical protein KAQ82_02405 [Dehalococcoidia bacterium]|nr:hypothetical protein [Dehalococcoidia bacterium]